MYTFIHAFLMFKYKGSYLSFSTYSRSIFRLYTNLIFACKFFLTAKIFCSFVHSFNRSVKKPVGKVLSALDSAYPGARIEDHPDLLQDCMVFASDLENSVKCNTNINIDINGSENSNSV